MTQGLMKALALWADKKPVVEFDSELKAKSYTVKYASLSAIVKAVSKPLSECGLSYTHVVSDGKVITYLMCGEDGGFLVSDRPLPDGVEVQTEGAYITYQKRYQLSALLGIATEQDKDAPEGASAGAAKPRATDTQVSYAINNPEKGMAGGNRQALDVMLTKYTLSAADVRALVEGEYLHIPERREELLAFLGAHGYELVKK